MINCKWLCPYCDEEYRSSLFTKHLFSKHFTQMFDPETTYGEKNIKLFTIDRKEAKPLCLYFPDGHKNPLIDICLGCMTGCAKRKSAEKHFEKPMKHNVLHLEKYNELKERILKAKEGKATPLGSNNSIVESATPPEDYDYTDVQKLIYRLIWAKYEAKKEARLMERYRESLQEHFESNRTLTQEEFEDYEPMGVSDVFLEEVPTIYKLPFPCDLETLIEKFEDDEDRKIHKLELRDPNKIPKSKKKPQEKKVLPPPAPKPAEPTPPPEPVQEPAPEPKPTPQPLASVLYQSYKPPPVAPSLPTIIQKTKRN